MGETTGGDQPAGGIRASDAERDATVERLSRAAGDGRLTLEEFSQRMEQATAAKIRADPDRLVAGLPAEPAAAGASPRPCPLVGRVRIQRSGRVGTRDSGGTGALSGRTGAPSAASGGPSAVPSGDRDGVGRIPFGQA